MRKLSSLIITLVASTFMGATNAYCQIDTSEKDPGKLAQQIYDNTNPNEPGFKDPADLKKTLDEMTRKFKATQAADEKAYREYTSGTPASESTSTPPAVIPQHWKLYYIWILPSGTASVSTDFTGTYAQCRSVGNAYAKYRELGTYHVQIAADCMPVQNVPSPR